MLVKLRYEKCIIKLITNHGDFFEKGRILNNRRKKHLCTIKERIAKKRAIFIIVGKIMIGKKLKEYRQNNKLSCMDMAEKISEKRRQMGLSTSISTSFMRTYSNWEKDNMPGTVSIVNLKILRDIMGCSYEYLLEDIDTFYPNAISIEDEYSISNNCFNKLVNYPFLKVMGL